MQKKHTCLSITLVIKEPLPSPSFARSLSMLICLSGKISLVTNSIKKSNEILTNTSALQRSFHMPAELRRKKRKGGGGGGGERERETEREKTEVTMER